MAIMCREVCTLANRDGRTVCAQNATDIFYGVQLASLLIKDGQLEITLVENRQSHVLGVKIPEDAEVKCGLSREIELANDLKSGGGKNVTQNCPYIGGQMVYLSINKPI